MKCFQWAVFSYNVSEGLICIFIIISFIFYRFRLVSPISYIVTFIPTINKFHKQTNNQMLNFTVSSETQVFFAVIFSNKFNKSDID